MKYNKSDLILIGVLIIMILLISYVVYIGFLNNEDTNQSSENLSSIDDEYQRFIGSWSVDSDTIIFYDDGTMESISSLGKVNDTRLWDLWEGYLMYIDYDGWVNVVDYFFTNNYNTLELYGMDGAPAGTLTRV